MGAVLELSGFLLSWIESRTLSFFCGLVLYNCWGKFCSYKGKGRRLIGHGTEKAPTVTGNTFGSSSDGKETSEKDGNLYIILTNLENKSEKSSRGLSEQQLRYDSFRFFLYSKM